MTRTRNTLALVCAAAILVLGCADDGAPSTTLSVGAEGGALRAGGVTVTVPAGALTETTELTNAFLVEAGSDNTFVQNELGVSVKINSSLALKTALQTRHNTDVKPGIDKTDTLFTTNLVFGFLGNH